VFNQDLSRIDLIRIIGDIITELDVARGSFPKESPERKEFDAWRRYLDEKQHALADAVFDEGSAAYQSASADIDNIARDMADAIADVNNTAQTFEDLSRLASAIDDLLSYAASAVKPV
jgi:hypothetical protein